jgi:hypothetical protein
VSPDRRRAERVAYVSGLLPPTAAVAPGRSVVVVNLSRLGMLLETDWHIGPSRLVEVRLQFATATLGVCADVLRAYVSALDSRRGLRYRAALVFSVPIAMPREPDLLESYRQATAR